MSDDSQGSQSSSPSSFEPRNERGEGFAIGMETIGLEMIGVETIGVVKIGGSLLSLPDLVPRLRGWLARHPASSQLLLLGGGAAVDVLREADRLHRLGEEACHWLAIRTLAVQARLLQHLLPEATWLDTVAGLQSPPRGLAIVDPWPILQADERAPAAVRLPHRWEATSDSIAARLATLAGAQTLALLKSASPPAGAFSTTVGWDLAGLTASGYLDPHFERIAPGAGWRLELYNLRDESHRG